MRYVIPQPQNNWYEYGFVELLLAQDLRKGKKKKLVLGGTVLKKGKFQSKSIVSLTQLKKNISIEKSPFKEKKSDPCSLFPPAA